MARRPESSGSKDPVKIKPASGNEKPVWRTFPGPRGSADFLRVAIDRTAYAELLFHAKESLEAEVCGVLAGACCEDEQGVFVHVEAVVRGHAAAGAATHVTFTQQTWNEIHQTLERDFPKLRIVGWYHTHPGFGVEFSDMDVFLQRNFFPGPAQIALVTDPLSGAVAIAANADEGIDYLPRFWVDGREQQASVPVRAGARPGSPAGASADADAAPALKSLESRVNQLVLLLDEQRAAQHRFLLVIGAVFCFAVIIAVGWLIYNQYTSRLEPPRLNSFAPVPVRVGDRTVLLGVGVVEWDVPPELNALILQLEQARREAEAKQTEEASPGKTAPAAGPPSEPSPHDPKP